MPQTVPDSHSYNKGKYDSILVNVRSSRAVWQIFDSEPSGLCKSDAMESEFSLRNIWIG